MTDATKSLLSGDSFPYDHRYDAATDDVAFEPAANWAHRAARGVLANLRDRRGIKWELEAIDDEDIRKEIVEALTEIIRQAHSDGAPRP